MNICQFTKIAITGSKVSLFLLLFLNIFFKHLLLQNYISKNALIQGVPKGTDTFKTLTIEKLDNLRIFCVSIKSVSSDLFFCNFGKTENLNLNGLTSIDTLCSISTQEKTKAFKWSACSSTHTLSS